MKKSSETGRLHLPRRSSLEPSGSNFTLRRGFPRCVALQLRQNMEVDPTCYPITMVIGGLSTVHLMIYMGNMRHGPSGNSAFGEKVNTRRLFSTRVGRSINDSR